MLKLANRQALSSLSAVEDELPDMEEAHSDSVFLSQVDLDDLSLDGSSSNGASFARRVFSDEPVSGDGDFDLSHLLDADTVSPGEGSSPQIKEAISQPQSKPANNVLDARQTGEESSGEASVAAATAASDVTALSQSCVADGRSEEEERRLVLASVKHVDCHDFPFEEVLSLEETVLRKEASRSQVAPDTQICSRTSYAEANDTMKDGGSVSIITHSPLPGSLDSMLHIPKERKAKRRPPLLKCPTWPRQDSEEHDSSLGFSQTTVSSSSKLDSPSFYSQSAIDFSAISHLSEEHDKMMAQEMSEKPQPQHPFISATTKERLYGKATKSRSQSQRGKGCKDTSRGSAVKISSTSSDFTVTHTKPNASIVCTRRHTVGEFEINDAAAVGGRKSTKAVMSPLEKAFRKQYSIASKAGTPVVPSITTLSTEAAPSSSLESQERTDAKKPGQQAPMEKQPLPPEGFKITRYPIKANSAATTTPASPNSGAETAEEGNASESDLYEIIKKLQRQQEKAEERIALAEKQAKEWKEIAQQTLRAAQVIKAQMEFEKNRANRAERRSSTTVGGNDHLNSAPVENHPQTDLTQSSGPAQRRWSNDVSQDVREGVTITRHRIVSSDAVASITPAVKRSSARGRKRSAVVAQPTSEGLQKRARVVSVPIDRRLPLENEQQKQQSFLDWLSSTEKEAGDISYMSLLECPPNSSEGLPPTATPAPKTVKRNPPLALTNRSLSHEEVRAALRAKVEHSRSHVAQSSGFETSVASDRPYKTVESQQPAPLNPDQYFRVTSAASPTTTAAVTNNISSSPANDQDDVLSDLLMSDNDCLPNSPEMSHSLSDSELQVTEKRSAQTTYTKPTLSKKLSSSEGFLPNLHLPATVTTDGGKTDSDFLSQLDCLFGL